MRLIRFAVLLFVAFGSEPRAKRQRFADDFDEIADRFADLTLDTSSRPGISSSLVADRLVLDALIEDWTKTPSAILADANASGTGHASLEEVEQAYEKFVRLIAVPLEMHQTLLVAAVRKLSSAAVLRRLRARPSLNYGIYTDDEFLKALADMWKRGCVQPLLWKTTPAPCKWSGRVYILTKPVARELWEAIRDSPVYSDNHTL